MRRFIHTLWVAVLAAPAFTASINVPAVASGDLCTGHRSPATRCQPGHGRRTQGGGSKVSHTGWPAVTGILWIVREGTNGQVDNGTRHNDELLGSHGGDTIRGGYGHDILWGDYLPTNNNGWQHDVIDGGPGRDWIYSSHGHNDIFGGDGNDHIWGHFGYGTIDCGPGYDVVHTKRHSTYRLRGCEKHLIH